MKRTIAKTAAALLIVVVLVVVIPLAINECYKHGGYATLWDASDVLAYYGTVLGAMIAVATLATTILFTRKQIQREAYLSAEKSKWVKIDEIFVIALKNMNPIVPLNKTLEDGRSNPAEAIKTFQKYQMVCRTGTDDLIACLSNLDYPKVKLLIDQIQSASTQYFEIAEKGINVYTELRDFTNRTTAQEAVEMEAKHPGSFPQETVVYYQKLIQDTENISIGTVIDRIKEVNNELVAVYEKIHRPLLKLKRTVFEQIENEIQKEADSILRLWRK